MKSFSRWWIALVVAALIGVAAFVVLRPQPAPVVPETPQPAPADGGVVLSAAAQRNAGILVAAVQSQPWSERLQAPGVLAVDETRTARLGAPVDGKAVQVEAFVGDRVVPGQSLALLESPVVHEAWAAYRRGRAELKHAEAELRFRVQAEARAQRLFADKAVSRQEVERAGVDRIAAEQALDMAKTELRRAEETMEHLGITSGDDPSGESGEFVPIRSPLAGAVLERFVTEGTATTTGMPLFVVSDLSKLWALAELDETLLPQVAVGMPVELRVAAYPEERFGGTIVFVGDRLDPKTRRVAVRCAVPNGDGRLKAEMFATLVFQAATERAALTIPLSAVQDVDGKPTVFVRQGEERFLPRSLELGATQDDRVEVKEGLAAGESIAVAGGFALKSELLKSAMEEE